MTMAEKESLFKFTAGPVDNESMTPRRETVSFRFSGSSVDDSVILQKETVDLREDQAVPSTQVELDTDQVIEIISSPTSDKDAVNQENKGHLIPSSSSGLILERRIALGPELPLGRKRSSRHLTPDVQRWTVHPEVLNQTRSASSPPLTSLMDRPDAGAELGREGRKTSPRQVMDVELPKDRKSDVTLQNTMKEGTGTDTSGPASGPKRQGRWVGG